MADIRLSGRMQAVADMVISGGIVADIGCDHAFVSIYLIENNIATRVIASDVRRGPVSIAEKNVASKNMSDRIDVRFGNGLATLGAGEADTIIIAGLGGMLMLDILKAGREIVDKCMQLILQPQSDVDKVRRYIYERGYLTADEKLLTDAGKYYNILDVRPDKACARYDGDVDLYHKFGKCLLEHADGTLYDIMKKQYYTNKKILSKLENIDTENTKKRILSINDEQDMLLYAFNKFYSE